MTNIGNASAFAGVNIDELSQIYGKTIAKGKLQAEEYYQFAERGIPLGEQISKSMGVTNEQFFKLMEPVSYTHLTLPTICSV